MRLFTARKADQVGIDPAVDFLSEFAHVGANREVGDVNAAKFIGIGVDVDERLAGMLGRDQLITVGGRLAEPRADGNDEVSVANALLQLGVGSVAKVAGIDVTVVGDRVLATERCRNRNSITEGEIGEVMRGSWTPVGAADNRHW